LILDEAFRWRAFFDFFAAKKQIIVGAKKMPGRLREDMVFLPHPNNKIDS